MRIEELELVCQEAARHLVAREDGPLPATVVLPLAEATRVVSLPDFPDDDPSRFDLLVAFARDTVRPDNASCFGFVAEAMAEAEGQAVDVVMVVFGARRRGARVTAAALLPAGDGRGRTLGDFTPAEDLEPTAMPFLSPLQHAVDEAEPDAGGGPAGAGGLPIFGQG